MRFGFWCLLMALVLGTSPATADDYDTGGDQAPAGESSDSSESGGSSSGGGFFSSLFGGKTYEKFEGRFIDGLKARHVPPPTDSGPASTGLQLALRGALGLQGSPVPASRLVAHVENVAKRLLEKSGITGITPKILIVADQQIHGSAFPDGTILLPLGVVNNMETEDQLAAIVAHELAHIILQHHGSDWFIQGQKQGLAALNFVMDLREKLKEAQGKNSLGNQLDDLKIRFIAKGVVLSSELLIASPYTREQEDEADLLGVDLMHAAGYSIDEMSVMLEKLARQEEQHLEEEKQRRDKQKKAEEELAAMQQSGGLFESLLGAVEGAFDALSESLRDEFGKKHKAALERLEAIGEYLNREYATAPAKEPTKQDWAALRSSPEVKQVRDGYRAVRNARLALGGGDHPAAVKEIQTALRVLGPQHSLPRLVAASMSARAGMANEADFYFRQSLSADWPVFHAYARYAEFLRAHKRLKESGILLERVKKEMSDPPQLLPELIVDERAIAQSGERYRQTNVALLISRCKLEPIDGLDKLCEKAAEGKLQHLVPLRISNASPIGVLGRYVELSGATLNARKGPGGGHGVLAQFKKGDLLAVLKSDGRWLKVRGPAGTEGWVAGWLTKKASLRLEEPVGRAVRAIPAAGPGRAPGGQRAAPPTSRSQSAQADAAERLRKLKQIFDQGLITKQEFDAKRAEILKTL